LKQALEALVQADRTVTSEDSPPQYVDIVAAIRAHLDNTKDVEPFGVWHQGDTEDESDFFLGDAVDAECCGRCIPLYLHPAPIPPGFGLLPLDKIDDVLEAMEVYGMHEESEYGWLKHTYKSMLAAAKKGE